MYIVQSIMLYNVLLELHIVLDAIYCVKCTIPGWSRLYTSRAHYSSIHFDLSSSIYT